MEMLNETEINFLMDAITSHEVSCKNSLFQSKVIGQVLGSMGGESMKEEIAEHERQEELEIEEREKTIKETAILVKAKLIKMRHNLVVDAQINGGS